MSDQPNLSIYHWFAPFYDFLFGRLSAAGRRRAIELLNVQADERVIIPGVGTGLDLPLLPVSAIITATDITAAMLEKARGKVNERNVNLMLMDAQALQFPDGAFDAAILNLILSVVPDGAAAFREAWRVLRVGGRAVIFDKFLFEQNQLSQRRRIIGKFISMFGTDPNRRLSDIIGNPPNVIVEHDEPSLLRGQYRIVLLRKG
ncbi:MAG: class I SAM-dependent methyltransferase [Chloroflexi bacterium]|nr:class I SAM-dependent methyltransferase [Chloroflexota bacterium]